MGKIVRGSKKVAIAIIGGSVVLVGLVLVPYPGPGWLIVFGGLAILSSEFEPAERLLGFAKGKYTAWSKWLQRQSWPIQALVLAGTGLVVLLTVWLLNMFGFFVDWFNLPWEWLKSPFFR